MTRSKQREVPPAVLLDTNVILDALLQRELFVDDARQILQRVEQGELTAFVCATTITTIDYLAAKALGAAASRKLLSILLELCEIAPVTRAVITDAIASPLDDFEDAVLCHAAMNCGLNAVITRNGKDFRRSGLNIYSPKEWLSAQSASK
jgi:predicted nucleic acid-binding protein